MKTLKFVFLLFILSFEVSAQNKLQKIESALINGDNKTAIIELSKIPKISYYYTLKRIAFGKASYNDYYEFASNIEVSGNSQHERLNVFLSKQKQPKSDSKINLDYVKMKWVQINNLRNDISLDKATKQNEKLKDYISKFSNKKSKDVIRAKIYADIHDIVLYEIQGKIEQSKSISIENIAKSYKLKDTALIIINKYFFNDYYVKMGQLENYIRTCKEILKLEQQSKSNSVFYDATIQQLLDAYIYKGDYDKSYVERLLDDLSKNERSRYNSYELYTKYLSSLESNDPAKARIFKKFGVNNIVELCDFMIRDSKNKINNNSLIYLYTNCGKALLKDKKYDEAFKYLKQANIETQRIYSEDLAETLASFQTTEIRKKKEVEIREEKEKNNIYIIFIAIIIGFLVFSIFLIFNIRSKKEILAEKNLENEILLKEIHHRIKNNFQTIASLLELQSKKIKDETVKEILMEGQNRINSMSMIHHRLYQNDDITRINFQEYCKQLVNHNVVVYNFETVHLDIKMNNILLDIDTAVPLGLIVNELITNTFKYAFTDKNNCEIQISLEETKDGEYLLKFQDNGKGLPADFNWTNIKSLGLHLIRRLTKQLHGNFNYYYSNGAVFEIAFKNTLTRNNID